MPVFDSTEQLYDIVLPFLSDLLTGPLRTKFAAVGGLIKVTYTEPDAVFLLDTTVDPPTVTTGDTAVGVTGDIEMAMTADSGHQLWSGEMNMTKALSQRRIKINGPMLKLLTLLPAFKPAFAEYRAYLERTGHATLL